MCVCVYVFVWRRLADFELYPSSASLNASKAELLPASYDGRTDGYPDQYFVLRFDKTKTIILFGIARYRIFGNQNIRIHMGKINAGRKHGWFKVVCTCVCAYCN